MKKYDPRYHPERISYSGSAPKGWTDEYRFAPYVRADLHEAKTRALELDVTAAKLRAEMADTSMDKLKAERDRLREALEKFAGVPSHGTQGGPLVSGQVYFEDGSEGDRLGVSPIWPGYIPKEWFDEARAALKQEEDE